VPVVDGRGDVECMMFNIQATITGEGSLFDGCVGWVYKRASFFLFV